MPTVITHPAIPLAMGLALGRNTAPPALVVAGVTASILPDLDIVTFALGIPLTHEYGHRGFSHSILFALLAAVVGGKCLSHFKVPWQISIPFLFICTISHGMLDAFTNGGHGIAFFWPWSKARFFSPYRMIQVSPIRIERILSNRIPIVLISEILWVWLPLFSLGLLGAVGRRLFSRHLFSSSAKSSMFKASVKKSAFYSLHPVLSSKTFKHEK